ncbi:hypothetical protein CKO27_16285 [Thiocystis violacea]|nr:hypothetical protein [Thiocystis violacea]
MQCSIKALLSAVILSISGIGQVAEAQDPPPTSVLFENVRIFDGTSERLSEASNTPWPGSPVPIGIPPETKVIRIHR